jgi:hypothetical protein
LAGIFAVTSHGAQALTTGRVVANFETNSSRSPIDTRLAYVAISRASEDARITRTLGQRPPTDLIKTAALNFTARVEVARLPGTTKIAVHEFNNVDSRLAAVSTEYARRPERSVILSLDRADRDKLTQLVCAEAKASSDAMRRPFASW